MNPTFETRELSGWGRYPVESCHVFRPEKRSEGSGHSGFRTAIVVHSSRSRAQLRRRRCEQRCRRDLARPSEPVPLLRQCLRCTRMRKRCEPCRNHSILPSPWMVSPRDSGNKVCDRGWGHRRRHSRQEPPQGRIVFQLHSGFPPAHSHRRGVAELPDRTSRDFLGHRGRHGPDGNCSERAIAAAAGRFGLCFRGLSQGSRISKKSWDHGSL